MVIYEGMADQPSDALETRTPMEVARCSIATGLAVTGQGGLLSPPRAAEDARAEMTLARLLGFGDEASRLAWRGPLEALAAGVETKEGDWVFRADFVTMDGDVLSQAVVSGLSLEETRTLADAVESAFAADGIRLTVVAPGRVIVCVPGVLAEGMRSESPFAYEGAAVTDALPPKRKNGFVRDFIKRSGDVLRGQAINDVRVDLGENPANALWLWGGGLALRPGALGRPQVAASVMASRSLMARGLAKWGGMYIVDLANPWADGEGKRPSFKIAELVKALRERDHVAVYVESRWPGGRYGAAAVDKVWALESLDHYVLGPLCTLMDACRPYRMALCVDGAVRAENGRPSVQPLPVIITGEGMEPDHVGHWDEKACAAGRLGKLTPETFFDRLKKE